MTVTIGQRIAELRQAQGLSQLELARGAKITQAAVSLIESGDRPSPEYRTIKAIARALGVSLADLDPDLERPAQAVAEGAA